SRLARQFERDLSGNERKRWKPYLLVLLLPPFIVLPSRGAAASTGRSFLTKPLGVSAVAVASVGAVSVLVFMKPCDHAGRDGAVNSAPIALAQDGSVSDPGGQ